MSIASFRSILALHVNPRARCNTRDVIQFFSDFDFDFPKVACSEQVVLPFNVFETESNGQIRELGKVQMIYLYFHIYKKLCFMAEM